MTNKHTPGPWVIDNDNVIYQEGTAEPIASAAPTADEKANAALIAAAPELLGALKMAEGYIAGVATNEPEEQDKLMAVIRAAIAKARGN